MGNQLKTFSELSLPDSLARALASMKYSEPTEIQARAIPVALEGKDVLGCAQTGTGKTAAFALPLIVGLLKNPKSTALILVPTRELGAQTISVLQQLTRHCPEIRSTLVIGGVSYRPQIAALRAKPRIIVATPGRLMDHMENRTVSLGHVSKVVLDEADRMLDLGFAPQIERILQVLPRERQTLLFSATLPAHIVKLAQKYLKNPVRITVGVVSQAAPKIEQAVIQTTVAAKNDVLHKELLNRSGSVIIFARTKRRTDKLAKFLATSGHKVNRIHGDRSQRQRTEAIEGFRKGKVRILVATDIAARGIDVPHVACVINYDIPDVPEDYIHRIGRTGRAGSEGKALCLVTPEDKKQWRDISRHLAHAK